MNNSTKSNMYTYSLDKTWETYESFLSGNKLAPICIAASDPLNEVALSALQKSCASLDYPASPFMFVSLPAKTTENSSATPTTSENSAENTLTEKSLLSLIEGLDPWRLIIADEAAVRLFEAAYHREIPFYKLTSLLARPTIAFMSFENMLKQEATKQQTWKLLKQLLKTEG